MTATCFAIAAPGLEGALRDEIIGLGVPEPTAEEGGVRFGGGLQAGMRVCLWSRIATRVRLRLGRFRARDEKALAEGLSRIDWRQWIAPEDPVPLSASSRRSRLRHTGLLTDAVARAVGSPAGFTSAPGGLHLRLDRNMAEVSVDLAGERLHLRGWRKEGGAAPLRETLAAGILRLAGWRVDEPFLDPMCGSGTLPIEAALIATATAPGLGRTFAFESWPAFDAAGWAALVAEARAAARMSPAPIIRGSDRHRGAIGSATRNAERAGMANIVSFERVDVADLMPPPGMAPGLLVTNPPYGGRIGGRREDVAGIYRSLGQTLAERFGGWRCFVLTPHRALAEATGLSVDEGLPLDNGGIRVRLFGLTSPSSPR
jgi:putative N6-adenine-specific DNA methylase